MAAKEVRRAAESVTSAEAGMTNAAALHRDHPAIKIISKLSEAGDQPQLRILSGGVVAAGLLTRRERLVRAGVRMLLAHELATALKNLVKHNIDRTRPRSAASKREARARLGSKSAKEETSFPSGHTAGAVAVAQAFAREFPEHRNAARAAAAFIGAAQVPRCAHYPTDVGAGAVLGVIAEAAVAALWPKVEREPDQLTPEALQPPRPRA